MKLTHHSLFGLLFNLVLPLSALAAPSSSSSSSLHAFEARFHSLLPRSSDPSSRLAARHPSGAAPIRLVGFKRVPVPEPEVAEFEARWNGKPAEWLDRESAGQSYNYFSHLWYDADTKDLRLYFPVSGGLVKHAGSGALVEADEWGQLPPSVRPEHIAGPGGCPPSVIGRYQTANVSGVPGNIIEDGVIRLADAPEAVRSADGEVYVFDFGIKMVHDHSHAHSHGDVDLELLRKRLIPADDGSAGGNDDEAGEEDGDGDDPGDGGGGCLANHHGENCSKAYGISEGRCKMDKSTCMDYNGYTTDCKKGTTHVFGIPTFSKVIKFVGSDCSVSVLRGHCYNELM